MKQYTRIINFEDIKIGRDFLCSIPNQQKLDTCRDRYEYFGILDRDIVLTESLILVDGYIGYLVLKESGYEGPILAHIIEGARSGTYIYGKHLGSDKEYAWSIPKNVHMCNLSPGDLVLVNTSRGMQPIIMTAIGEDYSDFKSKGLKSVAAQKVDNRNQMIKLYMPDDPRLCLNDYDTYYIVAKNEGDIFVSEANYCSDLESVLPEYNGNKKSGFFYQYDDGWGNIIFDNVIGATVKFGEIV